MMLAYVIWPFYDFCSFWCTAVSTVDKMQFVSFIFAVLLSITVHFIALRLGRAMHQHIKFCRNQCKCRNWSINCEDSAIFQFLEMAWNFIGWKFREAEMYHYAKFRQNRQIHCKDIAIFRFFKMAAIRHLGFGTQMHHPLRVLGGLYQCAKFGYDQCSSFDNMNVSIFSHLAEKKPIHAPKIRVLWLFDPLNRL